MTTRAFFTQLFTVMFNVSNLALYIESANEFPQHYNPSNSKLSNGNALEKSGFALIIIGGAFILAYCNQKTYSKTIRRVLSNYHHVETENQSTLPPKRDVFLSAISAVYKAGIGSTSLVALLKNQWNMTAAWVLSVICFPGNALSQFAIFAIPFAKKYHCHLPYWPKLLLSQMLTMTYNLPNVALYFNTANGFFKRIGTLNYRLTQGHKTWEYGAVIFLGFFSLAMFTSTQRAYSKKIANVFTDPKKVSRNEYKNLNCSRTPLCTITMWLESRATAFYKTLVTTLSLISLTFALTSNLPISITVAILCIPGNLLSQFSIFKPKKTVPFDGYMPIETYRSKTWCFGLFGKTIPEETVGFSLGNEIYHYSAT